VNRTARRRGTVFPDRYRMRILPTRSDVRSVLGALPLSRTDAWPQTWLLRVEVSAGHATGTHPGDTQDRRRWIRTRADEDS
jgi:hypothetical protein